MASRAFISFCNIHCKSSHACRVLWRALLTSTQVSISEYWFMMGRMVSMLLWSTRSDLFPTRIRGTLQNAKKLHHVFTIRSTLAAKLLKEACFPIHQSLTLFRVQALKLTAFLMMILTHIAMVRKHGKAPKLKTTHYSIILITQGMILLHPGLIL